MNESGTLAKKRKIRGTSVDSLNQAGTARSFHAGASQTISSFYNFPSIVISAEQMYSSQPLRSHAISGQHSTKGVNVIEFSDDGSFFVSGGDDGRVLLWSTDRAMDEHWKPKATEMGSKHKNYIFCLAVSPDNNRIYSGGKDDNAFIHDAKT